MNKKLKTKLIQINNVESQCEINMSVPVAQNQQTQSTTPQQQSQPSITQSGPPPVPSTKPVLSSPGAYMANFTSSTTTPTAGIHSVNKSHEKPAIAARPIPPPTLPKYSSSFNKGDRERNEFNAGGKLDRADREKVWNFIPKHRENLNFIYKKKKKIVFQCSKL